MDYPQRFDVIVVGGGHAGTEAALAAARMGCTTLLLTHNVETLGQMSCNPSIGGIGKSHLVREVDALGGAMARAADEAGIHFKILNSSKGPAVRATRAQADRVLYRAAIRRLLERQPNLWIFQQAVDDLLVVGERCVGAVTQLGLRFRAEAVVLTAGTFLDGRVHVGLEHFAAGRAGDPAAVRLSARLKELNLPQGRLKTGTPPRLDGRSVDFAALEVQAGDRDPTPVMSFLGRAEEHPRQIDCWVTHTNERTHEIIRSGFARSPMFTGRIEGVGPRYCPSVEDKINRFADKSSHQVFLEPEGLDTTEIYPNGISTSLPFDIQLAAVRSIRGLESAHIVRPGYAIEYDYFDPRGLRPSLETRPIGGLFFAGQINGTTGYEEAAAQGLLAGLNAALAVRGEESWIPARGEAYLGVLVDDLTSKGVLEPYRMFTSRAEHRLYLREDNADARLTEVGRKLGLVDDARWNAFNRKRDAVSRETAWLKQTWVRVHQDGSHQTADAAASNEPQSLKQLLKRPGVVYRDVVALGASAGKPSPLAADPERPDRAAVWAQVEVEVKYEGYVSKQREEVERSRRFDATAIPPEFDFNDIAALSFEVRQALCRARPRTLGEASRVSGVTPAAVSLMIIHLKRHSALHQSANDGAVERA